MLKLLPVTYPTISQWVLDYQKKSKNYELPPKEAQCLGIYRGEELIGYFILVCYVNKIVEINQGYLRPEARHKNLSKVSMQLLEQLVKEKGFKKIALATNRAVGSYIRFMRSMNYGIEKTIFSKNLGD